MKSLKILLLSISCSLLGACASYSNNTQAQQQEAYSNQKVAMSLAEAAGSVSTSLDSLQSSAQAANPAQAISAPPAPATYGMQMPISIDWNGPIGPLITKLAHIANYQLKTLGTIPAIPVIVSIHVKSTPVASILQNAGVQAGKRASIVVYPSTKTLELRYNDDNNM